MPNSQTVFSNILQETNSKMVVFDLDSTLYDVSPRTQLILHKFIELHADNKEFEPTLKSLEQVKLTSSDWGIREAIERNQIQGPQKLFTALRDYWKQHFFSSDFLHVDKPYPGAVDYVNHIHKSNIPIYYLTGRDRANMEKGTLLSLQEVGFPLHSHDRLIMKPTKGALEDEDYKVSELKKLKNEAGSIWFFENEPTIIHQVRSSCPDINVVWINTTHSRRAEPPRDLPTIEGHYRIK